MPNECNKPLGSMLIERIIWIGHLFSGIQAKAESPSVTIIKLDRLVSDRLWPIKVGDQLHVIAEQVMVKIWRVCVGL